MGNRQHIPLQKVVTVLPRPVLRRSKTLMRRKWRLRRKRLRKPSARLQIATGGAAGSVSYNEGYNSGYNGGYDKGHEDGYRQGRYDGESRNEWKEGVESLIDSFVPEYEVLADFTAEQIVAAGVESLRSRFRHLLTPDELGGRVLHALETKAPFSLVRLGDGELLTMAQDTVLGVQQVREQGSFLGYAGVNVPDLEARDQLRDAVRKASVVGIPKLRVRNYQPLAVAVFKAHGIELDSLTLTDSLINYYLYQAGYLSRITSGRRVLVVGTLAEPLSNYLRGCGVNVAAWVSPVDGVKDVPRVMNEIAAHSFDIAFVAAGVAAVLISQRIASELGKVAIDFGHLANSMLKGEAPFK
ncbi:GT-D fold domain-containing protein [Paenibacillus sp. GYB004]|uniref:GT-D fold domain-containing protein n=1 Tax=Paenibacillus sp. GYB004 TaxID=2994393 RepID=UPI002F962CF7